MCTIERESEREREYTKRRDSGTECVEWGWKVQIWWRKGRNKLVEKLVSLKKRFFNLWFWRKERGKVFG